jgi:hypothetical protein
VEKGTVRLYREEEETVQFWKERSVILIGLRRKGAVLSRVQEETLKLRHGGGGGASAVLDRE